MKLSRLLLLLLLASASVLHAADLKVAGVFTDHAVLQRESLVPVWGWADPGTKVQVQFAGQTKTASADATGKWLVKLDALPASAAPHDLTVTALTTQQTLVLHDLLVGEVWLGSGQSNMALMVKQAKDFAQEQAAANLPTVRMFREESKAAATPQADSQGRWVICAPDTVGDFSAALFFFGRELQKNLGVPVGLINSSVGGTPIEAWIAPEAQKVVKELEPFLAAVTAPPAGVKNTNAAARARNASLGGLFNGKIAPLIPYAIRGTIWYQGEANSAPAKAPFYQYQLPLLVKDWRTRWGYEFPFAWAQLPNFEAKGRDWPTIREAMLKTLTLPQTGMGINIDIGEEKNIHPKNKQEVGHRLALWALGTVYGQKVAATSGPLPASHEVRDGKVRVSFSHAEGGLVAQGGALTGFVVAGADHQWQPAQARIEGNQVMVSNPAVKQPVAVRYAWENFPTCNLYNGAGLPASPFRTDDWK